MNFHSTSYDWLVVAGARAQYKGTGTINQTGNYGFMLPAIDGQLPGSGGSDKFRIKIWDKNNGDSIVYDNQLGASDDADPTTALGGGSIVIHKDGVALHVTGSAAPGAVAGAPLSQAMLRPVVDQAVAQWAGAGIGSSWQNSLKDVDVQIANLSGSLLGMSYAGGIIWIDQDAAGYGWSTDSSADASVPASGRVDLLSVLAHELGHLLGLGHSHEHDLMAPSLAPGERRTAALRSAEDLHGHHPYSVLTGSLLEPSRSSERGIDSQALESAALLFEESSVVQREGESTAVQAPFVLWRNRSAADLSDYLLEEEDENEDEEQLLDELARELVRLRR